MSDNYAELMGTSYTSGSIHFTGLGSGTDFDTMVSQLVEAESQRLKGMAREYKTWEAKVSAVQEVNSSVLALEKTLTSMDDPTKFMLKTSSTSDETALTATASIHARPGNHSIEIHQLAQNHVLMSKQGFDAETTKINTTGGNETFEFTYNGETTAITIPSGTTLSGLVNMINHNPDNPGVRAALINDGSATGGYHLQLRGMDQGKNYEVQLTSSPAALGLNFDTSQAAQNAQVKVDGWPTDAGKYIERASNTLDDVVDGVTLNLKKSGETVTLSTRTDTEAIKKKITTFVEQVNDVLGKIRSLTEVSKNSSGALMTGNSTLRSIQSNIKNLLNTRGIGFDPDKDTISSIVGKQIPGSNVPSVGISTDTVLGSKTFGLLVLDETSLDNALQKDPQAVMEIFSAKLTPAVDTKDFSYRSALSGTTQAGMYDVSYEVNSAGKITSATIDGTTYNYGPAGRSDNILTSMKGGSKGLAITVDNLTEGTHTGTIRLKNGKIPQLSSMLETFTDSTTGSLTILEDNFQETIETLTEQMANEQQRLQHYEQEQRAKFARLESTLGYYNSIQKMLESQIKQLSSSSKG